MLEELRRCVVRLLSIVITALLLIVGCDDSRKEMAQGPEQKSAPEKQAVSPIQITPSKAATDNAPITAPEKTPPVQITPQVSEPQQSKYFPLDVGNRWVYRKTVSKNVEVFAWECPEIEKGKTTFVFGPVKEIIPGTTEETYIVKDEMDEDGRKRWLIDVGSEKARDGRYGCLYSRVDKIFWGRLISGKDVIEIGEMMVWEHFAGPFKQERTLLIEPLLKDAEVRIKRIDSIETVCSSKKANVSVPAGKFNDCLEIISRVEAPDIRSKTPKKGVWKTYSYYAPGIGLVKEEQKNDSGESTYILELTQHTIK